ncbi:protein STRUBBELIG-RECEPTOR FAMILY 8 [Amborella trichopoda]|uniref:protein STRUBBELIG-RECEPTOR FAMILY 8 n=1 Tax=Amborella trichopoda TaxID=13333 RepID=UPI0009BD1A1E|nr:protein STRUBBELIG-RECEPTOR FAMILY 8 [Amborella trichopoda]|eukprot:XP_020526423.1 protein STRUBBELIG-RECEPTOR FAMILY 8 [Amborella trichopoda]
MCKERFWSLFLLLSLWAILLSIVVAETDESDVRALQDIYVSLNFPFQLIGWNSIGGDPCRESWMGISCSVSAVTSIDIHGLGLTGTLGYQLSNLASLKALDVSNNSIHDAIPSQLPSNITYLNLAYNNFNQSLPYSISELSSLASLNVSHNSLSGPIGDIFNKLQNLSLLDLSFNNFTGDLPLSFITLSKLSNLFLQNNYLSGSVDFLSHLPLSDLNVENNYFSGWIPKEFDSIPYLRISGNLFQNGLMIGVAAAGVLIIVGGSLCFIFACYHRSFPKKMLCASLCTLPITTSEASKMRVEKVWTKNPSPHEFELKPPPGQLKRKSCERAAARKSMGKRRRGPLNAVSYSLADLQTATNSFGPESFVGGGSLGCVYKAQFPDGKVLAVKYINLQGLYIQEQDAFLEMIYCLSELKHPNIASLQGYCIEQGQKLLVYDYIVNGTLYDALHRSGPCSKILKWNARVDIALHIARGLEYLHSGGLTPIIHGNLKSENIMFDEYRNPRLTDCGLATLMPSKHHVSGSFGCTPPEVVISGVYIEKSDIYNFGVVLLELLTGRVPLDRGKWQQSLVDWATPQLHDIDALVKMVDPALSGIFPKKSLSRMADIISLCLRVQHVPIPHLSLSLTCPRAHTVSSLYLLDTSK